MSSQHYRLTKEIINMFEYALNPVRIIDIKTYTQLSLNQLILCHRDAIILAGERFFKVQTDNFVSLPIFLLRF